MTSEKSATLRKRAMVPTARANASGLAKSPRKRGSINKESIMSVASAMFRERGYDRTSLDDIAARLFVTKPSLYYHFSSKEDILLECIAQGYILFQQSMAERDDVRFSGRERVRLFIEAYIDLLQDNILSMIVADERVMSDSGKVKYRNYKRFLDRELRDRLDAGRRDGTLAFEDLRVATYAIFGMINWITHWQSAALSIPPPLIKSQFSAMIFGGIAAT